MSAFTVRSADRVLPRFDHVAFAVYSLHDVVDLMQVELGGLPCRYEQMEFNYGKLRYRNGALIEFIFGERVDFISKFLSKRGPGLHHITFIVCETREELVGYRELLVGAPLHLRCTEVTQPDLTGWTEFFISPSSADGTLIQLAACKSSTYEGEECWPVKPQLSQGTYGPTVNVYGVEIHVHHPSVFKYILGEVLGGVQQSAGPNCDVYAFSEGPMRIYCRVVPTDAPVGLRYLLVSRPVSKWRENHPLAASIRYFRGHKL